MVPTVNGNKHGQYVYYHENGELGFTANIKNDKLHGTRYCFSEDGVLWHIHEYRRGKQVGPNKIYDVETGSLSTIRLYRNNKLHGRYIGYLDSGLINSTGRYKKGKKNGIWKNYDSNGKIVSKEKFRKDESVKTKHY